ncbi:MAG: PDZ domain-containing protein, partial [Chromatiales bacterium]|nr:PDZ domain-containing protein [Chromatiales bacterium]
NAPGVLVNRVLARGPAAQAGLLPGDLITAVEGQLMLDPQMAVNAISAVAPGAKVRLTVLRSGKERQLTAVVSQRPS